jgi:hypothetical protein
MIKKSYLKFFKSTQKTILNVFFFLINSDKISFSKSLKIQNITHFDYNDTF